MKYPMLFACLLTIASSYCLAQSRVEPMLGYNIDLNSSKYTFKQVNTGVQFSWQTKDEPDFLLKFERGWGLSTTGGDSAFSLNPSLPLYTNAVKKIQPNTLNIAPGVRLKMAGKKDRGILSALLFLGLSYQRIGVSYTYDKANYVILNPDKTLSRIGAFVSGGIAYMQPLANGRLFGQLNISTKPVGGKQKYPSSFQFLAPLSFNAGYSFTISKTKK